MGKLSSCNDGMVFHQEQCNGTMPDTDLPRIWTNLGVNFGLETFPFRTINPNSDQLHVPDWIGESLFSSYQIAITDTWFQSMLEGMSSTGTGLTSPNE